MSTLTIRLPEDTAERLKSLARSREDEHEQVGGRIERPSPVRLVYRHPFSGAGGNLRDALTIFDRLDDEDRDAGKSRSLP